MRVFTKILYLQPEQYPIQGNDILDQKLPTRFTTLNFGTTNRLGLIDFTLQAEPRKKEATNIYPTT